MSPWIETLTIGQNDPVRVKGSIGNYGVRPFESQIYKLTRLRAAEIVPPPTGPQPTSKVN